MGENYIVINGEKAELTKEQLIALGIVDKFERVKKGNSYYYINSIAQIIESDDDFRVFDNIHFNTANYCADKKLLHQRALHETLNRLLWRFSFEHGWTDEMWGAKNGTYDAKFYINYNDIEFMINWSATVKSLNEIYFVSSKVAEQAIEEVIKPFMKKYPEFVW